MLSKLIEVIRLIPLAHSTDCANGLSACGSLARQVDQQDDLLLTNLTRPESIPVELCKTFVLFPNVLGRVGAHLERIPACCDVKCREGLNFSVVANDEVDQAFKLTPDMMTNSRDTLIAPNGFLMEHVISQSEQLDQMCQGRQLAHVERLLKGRCAPHASSVHLDLPESTQSLGRHIKEMAKKTHSFAQASHAAG